MTRLPKFLLSAAMVATMATSFSAVMAATPADTLVQAWQSDDIISLDPAEVFEFSASEIIGNTYERLISYDIKDVSKISGQVAESWTVSPDGKTYTFKIKPNRKFASGNPITAEDVVYSLHRAVALDKSPAFILGQFGLTKDNVKDKVKQTGPLEMTFEVDKAYAPTLVLYCLGNSVASIVDKKLLVQNEKDGDFGYNWLKTKYAGSGPYIMRDWKANEVLVLERNPNYEKKTPLARVIFRHIKETASQRLLLEKGDIDVARNLNPEEIAAVSKNADIKIQSGPKGTVYYLGLNQKNPNLAKPEVRQALKYLVDYSAIADTIMKNKGDVHQNFLPKGFLGAETTTPLQARRRQGEGASGQGRPEGRLLGDHGHPLHRRDHRHRAGDAADLRAGRHQARDPADGFQAGADQVPRPPARHLYRQLGLGLPGPELQRRHLRGQRRQLGQCEGKAPRMAQCLGSGPADGQDPRRRDGA